MRLVVVGAAGGVGRQIVEQGLGHGHEIVAIAEDSAFDIAHERLRVLHATTRDRDAIAEAAQGADAVLAALEAAAGRRAAPIADAMASAVSAAKLARVRRFVALSAAGVGESLGTVPLIYRLKVETVWREVFADLAAMEEVVLFSGLDWTLLRPAPLTDGPLTGLYRTRDNVLPERGKSVSRADAAAMMLKSLSSQRYVGRIIAFAD